MEEHTKTLTYSRISVIFFTAVLTLGGVLSIVLPKKEISEIEKRKLCKFPTFSTKQLFEGNYTDSLELYYADNFPFRDDLVWLGSSLKEYYGYSSEDEVKIYNLEAPSESEPETDELVAKMDSTLNDSTLIAKMDSIEVLDTVKNGGEYVKSVFIYGGKAFQIFGGTQATASSFANLVNKYQETLGDKVQFYCMEIPTPTDFYLPPKYKNKNNYEKKNIDFMYSKLVPEVKKVYAFEELQKNTDQYLFFNTDHHWTGLGAYYAYRAFCASAGVQPYELSQLEKKIKKRFLGSLYGLTRDKRLKENPDSVVYFKLPVTTTVKYYTDAKSKKGISSKLFAESASGGNSYSVFLGGDSPLVKVVTSNKNGKKIMIIKDSFGNAFAPYLALHYEEVYIADYRYFNTNIPDFIEENGINEFLFAHNTFVVNTRYSVIRETALLKSYKGKSIPKVEVKLKDSSIVVTDTIKK